MKRKLLIGILLLATASTMAACGTTSTPSSTVTITQAPDTPTPEPMSKEDVFLTALRTSGNSYLESADSSDLLDVGYETCNMLDQGYTVDQLVYALASSGNFTTTESQQAVGFVLGAAVSVFCPEYGYQIS